MEFFAGFSILTLSILGAIFLLTMWFIGPGYNSHSATHSPTILTSVGIFGTFLGVALGLLDFDTSDIQSSVPSLIGGLKTAFWTSIAGLVGALLVKFRHLASVLKQREVEEQYRSATVTDLANLLSDIRDSLTKDTGSGLRSTLVSMHKDQEKQMLALSESLQSYETRMVKANTAALISALKEVMRNFNTQINEQYGDNFKELNSAVGKMLEWQKSYKVELEKLLTTQQSNGDLLDKASQAYEKTVAHTEVFSDVSHSLGTMLNALQSQSERLDAYLTQLAKVADKAAEGLPALEQRIDSITTELARSVTSNQQQLTSVLQSATGALDKTVVEVNRTLSETLVNSQQGLHTHIESMVARTEKQIMRLDDAMEDELVKALKTFGYQLTSLSEKFVSDYAPLTEKLQAVLSISETVTNANEAPQRRIRIPTQ
ncbi:hypothetical protein NBRC116494_14150 [Aurantivibrio plasticivorans]